MDNEGKCFCEKKLPKANELPMYECLEDTYEYEVAMKAPSPLEQKITHFRKSLTGHIDSFQVVKDQFGNVFETALSHTKTGYYYITDDNNTLPKAAAITFGGLSGLLFGIRGGIFKKIFYSGTGMMVFATVCYPKQAFEYSKSGFEWTKAKTTTVIKKTTGFDLQSTNWNITEKLPYKPSFDKISEQVSEVQQYGFRLVDRDSLVKGIFTAKKMEGDPGQSVPTDKDLYTTRSKCYTQGYA